MKPPKCPLAAVERRIHVVRESGDCVTCALADEIKRFNLALSLSCPLILDWPDSMCNGHLVDRMSDDMWLTTHKPYGSPSSWCLANDSRWAKLMALVDIPRHELFAEFDARGNDRG